MMATDYQVGLQSAAAAALAVVASGFLCLFRESLSFFVVCLSLNSFMNLIDNFSIGSLMLNMLVQNYCLGVYLVRQLSSATLLNRLKQIGTRHPDHTRALSQYFSELVFVHNRLPIKCGNGE